MDMGLPSTFETMNTMTKAMEPFNQAVNLGASMLEMTLATMAPFIKTSQAMMTSFDDIYGKNIPGCGLATSAGKLVLDEMHTKAVGVPKFIGALTRKAKVPKWTNTPEKFYENDLIEVFKFSPDPKLLDDPDLPDVDKEAIQALIDGKPVQVAEVNAAYAGHALKMYDMQGHKKSLMNTLSNLGTQG